MGCPGCGSLITDVHKPGCREVPRRDYAIGPSPQGMMVHRPDCPKVRAQAEAGLPVMTLINCAQEPGDDTVRCDCMDEEPAP